jgi:hypothetical protein
VDEGRELMGYEPMKQQQQAGGDGQSVPVPQVRPTDLADRVAKILSTGR